MTFTSTILNTAIPNHVGDRQVTYGTFGNATGDTGGSIDTGLKVCEVLLPVARGSAATTILMSVSATTPCDGSTVTIITGDGQAGDWLAYGY